MPHSLNLGACGIKSADGILFLLFTPCGTLAAGLFPYLNPLNNSNRAKPVNITADNRLIPLAKRSP